MSLDPSSASLFKPISYLPSPQQMPVLEEVLSLWKTFVDTRFCDIEDPHDAGVVEDYKCVLFILFDDIQRQKVQKDRDIFVIHNALKKTQGLASCHVIVDPLSKLKAFTIDALLTAPWNLSLHSIKSASALKGVGSCLLHLMFQKACLLEADHIQFDATGSSISFYERLGFSKIKFNKFCASPKDADLKEKIHFYSLKILKTASIAL